MFSSSPGSVGFIRCSGFCSRLTLRVWIGVRPDFDEASFFGPENAVFSFAGTEHSVYKADGMENCSAQH